MYFFAQFQISSSQVEYWSSIHHLSYYLINLLINPLEKDV